MSKIRVYEISQSLQPPPPKTKNPQKKQNKKNLLHLLAGT